jgi:hypothetical protein
LTEDGREAPESLESTRQRLRPTQVPATSSGPLRVELFGPPGCGKSSLLSALERREEGFTAFRLRDSAGPPELVRSLLRTAGPFASQAFRFSSRRWYRWFLMVQLEAHWEGLRRRSRGSEVTVLDQGPLYLMTILNRSVRHSAGGVSLRFERYWEATLDRYGTEIQVVVALDAPDEVLQSRVLERGTPHPLLRRSAAQATELFEGVRGERDALMDQIARRNPAMKLIRLDTHLAGPVELARQVAHQVGGPRL